MRRVLTVCFLGMVAPVGLVSAAHATEASAASQAVDRIFAESLPGNRDSSQSSPPASAPTSGAAEVPSPGSISAPAPAPAKQSVLSTAPANAPTPARAAAPAPARAVAPAPAPSRAVAPAPAPSRAVAPAPAATSSAPVRRVSSTAYCLTGRMASGKNTYSGAAAMNGVPLGSRFRVLDGPRAGSTFVVEDRIGHSSGFDIAYPGNCGAARQYGRRTISIQQA